MSYKILIDRKIFKSLFGYYLNRNYNEHKLLGKMYQMYS